MIVPLEWLILTELLYKCGIATDHAILLHNVHWWVDVRCVRLHACVSVRARTAANNVRCRLKIRNTQRQCLVTRHTFTQAIFTSSNKGESMSVMQLFPVICYLVSHKIKYRTQCLFRADSFFF